VLDCALERLNAVLHDYTAGSGLPHSRQNAFKREVINPQNGHIRCDRKPAIGPFSLTRTDVVRFLSERVMKVRKPVQNGWRTGSIGKISLVQGSGPQHVPACRYIIERLAAKSWSKVTMLQDGVPWWPSVDVRREEKSPLGRFT